MVDNLFGPVLIFAIVGVITLLIHFFNLKDRYYNWKNKTVKIKFKKKHLVNNPDFTISISYTSNLPLGKCDVHVAVLNKSNDIKYLRSIVFNYFDDNNPKVQQPTLQYADHEKWPKRLEHGQEFSVTVPFQHALNNNIYSCWKKNIKLFATCDSTTGDLKKSNSIDYDLLTACLQPINQKYLELAQNIALHQIDSERNIITSLWQLQIFGYLTSHIAKQLQMEGIPIIEFLVNKYKLEIVPELWMNWQHDLNRQKISEKIVYEFLQTIVVGEN